MYTIEERERLRADLLRRAAGDPRLSGGAITGSGAAGKEDRWSDIDLAFGVREAGEVASVVADWTAHFYGERGAVHHYDVHAGPWLYRVFLLSNTLQVDVAFVKAAEFRPLGPTFRLEFGEAKEAAAFPGPAAEGMIGLGWLYGLHARSCIARGKVWQAEYMIRGVRDCAMVLACLRHGVPAVHGRGFDELPAEVRAGFEGSLARGLETGELGRAFEEAMRGLEAEIGHADAKLGERLQGTLREMTKIW